MLPISIGVSSQAATVASFSASLENISPEPEIALKLVILDSGFGMLSVNSQGTTNQQGYDSGQVIGGQNQGAPALAGVECQISDGVNTPITLTGQTDVIGLY